MYTIGAAPAIFRTVAQTVAQRAAGVAPQLPRVLPTVTAARVAPIAPAIVARAATAAVSPPAGRMRIPIAPVVARAAALPRTIGPTEGRSISPTAPTITPRIAPRPGSLVSRLVERAKGPAPPAPDRARARVSARPSGSTVPVPVTPFEAHALIPPPAMPPKPLPPASPFRCPTTGPDVFQDEQATSPPGLYETEAEPLDDLLPPGADVPEWIDEAAPGMPAATEEPESIGPLDPLDELDLYDELGQGPTLSELELERVRREASGGSAATAVGAVRSMSPFDVAIGIGALAVALYVISRAAPPKGRRYGGGKARWD